MPEARESECARTYDAGLIGIAVLLGRTVTAFLARAHYVENRPPGIRFQPAGKQMSPGEEHACRSCFVVQPEYDPEKGWASVHLDNCEVPQLRREAAELEAAAWDLRVRAGVNPNSLGPRPTIPARPEVVPTWLATVLIMLLAVVQVFVIRAWVVTQ